MTKYHKFKMLARCENYGYGICSGFQGPIHCVLGGQHFIGRHILAARQGYRNNEGLNVVLLAQSTAENLRSELMCLNR